MSKVIWQKTLLPDLGAAPVLLEDASYNDSVENTRSYAIANSDIEVPDPKAFRSMSRASLFISNLCMGLTETLKPYLDESPFSVGIYCAVENGPIDAPSTRKIIENAANAEFAKNYQKMRNPKMYLKQLPNLVPAQMGISMGLQGLMNVYTHSIEGSIQALEQAEWDLKTKTIKAALVCSAHAFDDFLVVKRTREFDPRTLTEGAAVMLLVDDGQFTDWTAKVKKDPKNFYGISDPLIQILV